MLTSNRVIDRLLLRPKRNPDLYLRKDNYLDSIPENYNTYLGTFYVPL